MPRWSLVFGFVVAACSGQQAPVPVGGDVRALVGRWTGSYESDDTGRSGSIVFTLDADADTAHGDVVMVPPGARLPLRRAEEAEARGERSDPPHVLTIRFVRLDGDRVRGVLGRYRDPVCGCVLHTTFEGRLSGGRIVGTFRSEHVGQSHSTVGTWSVTRG